MSGRLFRVLCIGEVVRTAADASGLDWHYYPVTTTEDAFVVLVHYDRDGPMKRWRLYHWHHTDWVALYKDAKNDDVHVLDEPLLRKLSDHPLVLDMNELLEVKGVEVHSIDTGLSLWPKVASLVLTRNDFETGCAYDPNMWTARQRHGFRNFKVTLSEPRLRGEDLLRVGGQHVEWTDLCILQPCLPFDDTSAPVNVFEASPRDSHTFGTDAASIKQLTVTITDTVDDAKVHGSTRVLLT